MQDSAAEDFGRVLVHVAATRDVASFEVLFRFYGPRIRSYMMRRATDASLAEELMQETMMTVWRKADQFDPARGTAAGWIFTIARNVRVDHIRKANRPAFDPTDPAFIPDEPLSPDAGFEADESAERLRNALGDLPDDQAELLRMSFFEEIPHSGIAERLGLPLGTVKSRIRSAFTKLRQSLGEVS
ncbi:sigma-70 family RNA polymerase sigma factor [Martelella alba]|uniref:sigma-70 family RNA polymerase sigma factor n=1 Tax=Martelella alba TaxID=2590451 RepID=UPI001F421D46|nr:sigma-70 family RNA polymerase sigma factor [Martelella alba]